MRVGLYSTQTGVRTRLAGNDDGQRRYMLGNVIVANHGTTLRFEPAPAPISGSNTRVWPERGCCFTLSHGQLDFNLAKH
jgi:hypothetical protein